MEIKRTQQDISSLKKQLSELRGLFKGKERKSLEGRIEPVRGFGKAFAQEYGADRKTGRLSQCAILSEGL